MIDVNLPETAGSPAASGENPKKLSADEAAALIRAIEDVEREEANDDSGESGSGESES